MHRVLATRLFGLLALASGALTAAGQDTVADFVRLEGQGESVLQGLGIVTGLPGTGDSGEDLVMARPLANVLEELGNPLADLRELGNARSAAVVLVTCTVPRTGAVVDDNLDVRVSVYNAAQSLRGGELFLSPLVGPLPDDPAVYAFAQGPIKIEDPLTPTVGVVRGGARIVRDINTTPQIGAQFDLILRPAYVGFQSASYIADVIQDDYLLSDAATAERIAVALGPRRVRVFVPEIERPNVPAFLSRVMQTQVAPDLMGLPATIIANTRTGGIAVDGDVEIEPTLINHNGLTITTTIPEPEPTPEQPIVRNQRWADVGTEDDARRLGNVNDLLAALTQLDVPTTEQIEILSMLHEAGKLHARLIVDGVEQ